MSDLISRQATIDAIWTHATNILENSDYDLFIQDIYKMMHQHIAELIQHLPSAEPVKYAYVIVDEDGNMECSNCGSGNCFDNYCGNCGAKLIGEQKDGVSNGC